MDDLKEPAAAPPLFTFASLFYGRCDAWGTGLGPIEKGELTPQAYANHLAGRGAGLGVFPMLDDGTVLFAAIDLDEPDFELARLMQRLIPGESWVERSRSGNAHVWVFFGRPAPAWAVRTILRGATEAVGRKDVEIFPKQDGLRAGGVGNYINLPYFGDSRPILYATPTGLCTYTLEAFVTDANASRQDPAAWERRARQLGGCPPEERERASDWGTAPVLHMCAERIVAQRETNPIRRGHRHEVLFHLACQLLNYADFDEAEARYWLDEVNAASPHPLDRYEVNRLFCNAAAGRFTFTGCDSPVMQPYVHPNCPIANGGRT